MKVAMDPESREEANTPIDISVVCPFYNEELVIEAAIKRMTANLEKQFEDVAWELILVDDGSTDRSLTFAKKTISKLGSTVEVISFERNQGRGRALKAGIESARGDVIVTTEVDCSWGDDIALRLSEALKERPESDFVIASPHLEGGGLVNVTPSRVFLTRAGNVLIKLFFASHVTMNTGMTRAYRRRVIQPLVTYENGKEFHLEVLLKLTTLGFRASEIPATITWQDHKLARDSSVKRKSSTNIRKTINTHLRFLAIAQPVKYFAWLSVISLLVGIAFMMSSVWMLLSGGAAVFLAIIGLILLLFCLLFLGFSVLFFQIREIMKESWVRYYPDRHPPYALPAVQVREVP